MNTSNIVQKLWNYCNVLRDDGMSYGDYVEQLTYLLFLKMADKRTKAPYNQKSPVPKKYSWPSLVKKDGDELFDHYRHTLEGLGNQKGLLGLIFNKSQNKFQDPAKLRRLVIDLIDKEEWVSMSADVKGDAYKGLLEKNAQDTKSGAGQYFTPRPLIQAIVEVMAPKPDETVSDPACGTGGFLLTAHDYVVKHNPSLTKPQKAKLKEETFKGWELVQATAQLCAMNMLLHGIGSQDFEPIVVSDSLAADPGDRFDLVLTNPPFGKKSSTTIVGEEGKVSKQRDIVERGDFWTTTSNKQLNFVQHVKTLLKQNGRSAVVVADNVLFEGSAGGTIRRKLLHEHDVHTLLRLPTGLLRPGRESERAVLRQETRLRDPMDQEGLDLRPAHQPALHTQDQPLEARGPRRIREALQPREPSPAQGHLVRQEAHRPLACLRVQGPDCAGQDELGHLLAPRPVAGRIRQPSRSRRHCARDRVGPGDGVGAVSGDCRGSRGGRIDGSECLCLNG